MDGQKDSGLRDQRRLHKEVGLNCVLMCEGKGGESVSTWEQWDSGMIQCLRPREGAHLAEEWEIVRKKHSEALK